MEKLYSVVILAKRFKELFPVARSGRRFAAIQANDVDEIVRFNGKRILSVGYMTFMRKSGFNIVKNNIKSLAEY